MSGKRDRNSLNWEKASFYAREGKPRLVEKYLRVADVGNRNPFSLLINAYRNQERLYRDKARESAAAGDTFSTEDLLDRTHMQPDTAFNLLVEAYRQADNEVISEEAREDIDRAVRDGAVSAAEEMMRDVGLEGEEYFRKMVHAYRNRFDAREKAEYLAEKGRAEETFDYLEKSGMDEWEAFNIAVEAFRNQQE